MDSSSPNASLCAYEISVIGTVQRVGYRRIVLRRARKFHVSGYVENLDDDTVKIRAQGDPTNIESFLREIKINDGLVDFLEPIKIKPAEVSKEESGFRIKYGKIEQELEEGFAAEQVQLALIIGDIKDIRSELTGIRSELTGIRSELMV